MNLEVYQVKYCLFSLARTKESTWRSLDEEQETHEHIDRNGDGNDQTGISDDVNNPARQFLFSFRKVGRRKSEILENQHLASSQAHTAWDERCTYYHSVVQKDDPTV